MGFRVIPLHTTNGDACSCKKGDECTSAGKHPRTRSWQRDATRDPEVAARHWRRWPDANIGVAMGGGERYIALDLDGPTAYATLDRLEAEHTPLPDTLTVRSGRVDGGEHRIFRVPDELDIGAIRNATGTKRSAHPGIDIRAEGGQIVAPPSIHASGHRYAFVDPDQPIAELPGWLYELLTADVHPEEEPRPPSTVPLTDRIRRAEAYIERVPGAIDGQNAGTAAFVVAMKVVRGFDLPVDVAVDLLRTGWAPRCRPPMADWRIRRKVEQADGEGTLTRGELLEAQPPRHTALAPRPASPPAPPAAPPPAPEDPPELPEDPQERPRILVGTELHATVDRAAAELRRDPGLYQRDGYLVHVVRPEEAGDELQTPGTPQIRLVPSAQLTERLTRCARFFKIDGRRKDPEVPCLPSSHVVNATIARGRWPGVRPLVGVLEAPTMRPDGSIIQRPGYDAATGYLYDPQTRFPRVPDRPTQADANAALAELCEIWLEFPFAVPEALYVPIAALLTLLARPAIAGAVPAFVLDASTRGSGKTLLSDTIALLATGRGAARMTWPPNPEELEKVLGAYALRGAALVSFDNIETKFGGAALDRVLTAEDRVELRVLGKSEVPTLPWRATVLASGNNMVLGADTTRRVLLARLEPNVERPEARTGFRHHPLLGWLRTQRPRLVVAALTILRAYVVAGRPDMELPAWGSYDAWRGLIAQAIVFAGGGDVLSCRASGAEDDVDPELAALRTFLHELPRLASDDQLPGVTGPAPGLTARAIVSALYPPDRLRGHDVAPDGWDDLREAIEAVVPTRAGQAPRPVSLGARLRRWKGRVVGGRKLGAKQSRTGVQEWQVEVS